MPKLLDPAWEYWTPDPEIAELLGEPERDAAGTFLDPRLRDPSGRLSGFRVGRRPNGKTRLGRPRRKSPDSTPTELPPVTCACGWTFRPARAGRVYCSRACVVPRKRLAPIDCGGCGKRVQPMFGGQVYCSRKCAPKVGGVRVLPDYTCRTCGVTFRPTCARRKICSPACLRNRGAARRLPDRACKGCGATFRPDRASRLYCSNACYVRPGRTPKVAS